MSKQKKDFMEISSLKLILAFVGVLALLLPVAGLARRQGKPLTKEDLAQVWVGVSSDQHYLLRLSLGSDGTGIGGYVFLKEAPRTFAVSAWSYEDGRLEINAVPPGGPPSWVGLLKGMMVGQRMELTRKGQDWMLKFWLRSEAELEGRWRLLKREMDTTAASQPR